MRRPTVGVLVVVAILIGFGIAYFWRGQEIDRLRDALGDVKSSMGMEINTLRDEVGRRRAALEEAERRLEQEQKTVKTLEDLLMKARVLK